MVILLEKAIMIWLTWLQRGDHILSGDLFIMAVSDGNKNLDDFETLLV